jgi:DNA-binding helix-hairpin-helix protein with protein kinase domain
MADGVLTPEEIAQMQKDIEEAKSKLVSKDTEAVIQRAKEEAMKELEAKQRVEAERKAQEDKDKLIAELKAKVESQEKEAASKFEMLQKKLDEMASSKAVIPPQDPFTNQTKPQNDIDKWSDAKVNELEEKMAREFFGADYDRP